MTKNISHKNNLKNSHIPVLADQVIENLNIRDGFTYVDGTYGAGGHTNMILSSADCKVVSIDRDPSAKLFAEKTSNQFPNKFSLINGNIGRLKFLLKSRGIKKKRFQFYRRCRDFNKVFRNTINFHLINNKYNNL